MDYRQEDAILKELGQNLKKIREGKGLSIRQLADLADMNHGNILKIEHGQVSPRIPTIYGLAEALNIHPRELLP